MAQLGLNSQPESATDTSVKFDSKGSLHILSRDDDGKLVYDQPLWKVTKNENELKEIQEELTQNKKVSKSINIMFYAMITFLGVLLIMCMFVLKFLGGM